MTQHYNIQSCSFWSTVCLLFAIWVWRTCGCLPKTCSFVTLNLMAKISSLLALHLTVHTLPSLIVQHSGIGLVGDMRARFWPEVGFKSQYMSFLVWHGNELHDVNMLFGRCFMRIGYMEETCAHAKDCRYLFKIANSQLGEQIVFILSTWERRRLHI